MATLGADPTTAGGADSTAPMTAATDQVEVDGAVVVVEVKDQQQVEVVEVDGGLQDGDPEVVEGGVQPMRSITLILSPPTQTTLDQSTPGPTLATYSLARNEMKSLSTCTPNGKYEI